MEVLGSNTLGYFKVMWGTAVYYWVLLGTGVHLGG